MAGNQYSKLAQADEEIACQFVPKEKHIHENDAKRRLITACVFCTVFIICEVIGESLFWIFSPILCNIANNIIRGFCT